WEGVTSSVNAWTLAVARNFSPDRLRRDHWHVVRNVDTPQTLSCLWSQLAYPSTPIFPSGSFLGGLADVTCRRQLNSEHALACSSAAAGISSYSAAHDDLFVQTMYELCVDEPDPLLRGGLAQPCDCVDRLLVSGVTYQ